MCSLVITYMDTKGIKYEFLNNGDDVVLIISQKHIPLLADLTTWFHDMGFKMEVEPPVSVLEELEFCQMHPIEVSPGRWTMVRNFPHCVAKDCVCLEPTAFRKWIHSVGVGGQSITQGIPILNSFYKCLERNGDGTGKKYEAFLADSGFFRYIHLGGQQRHGITATARA